MDEDCNQNSNKLSRVVVVVLCGVVVVLCGVVVVLCGVVVVGRCLH